MLMGVRGEVVSLSERAAVFMCVLEGGRCVCVCVCVCATSGSREVGAWVWLRQVQDHATVDADLRTWRLLWLKPRTNRAVTGNNCQIIFIDY